MRQSFRSAGPACRRFGRCGACCVVWGWWCRFLCAYTTALHYGLAGPPPRWIALSWRPRALGPLAGYALGALPARFVWSPFWQAPIKAPKHFAVVRRWPRFACGVPPWRPSGRASFFRRGGLRAPLRAPPVAVGPFGPSSAPPVRSPAARGRPPQSARRLRVRAAPSALAPLAAWRPGSAGAPLCRSAPAPPSARSSVGRLLAAPSSSVPRPLGPPRPVWGPALLQRAGPGRLAPSGRASFPRVGPRAWAAWLGALRVLFLPPPVPPLGGAVLWCAVGCVVWGWLWPPAKES